jgi:HSP20 family protein
MTQKNRLYLLTVTHMSNIIRWSPFFDSFDKDFEDMLERFPTMSSHGRSTFMPAVDMYEDGNNVIVETQLAGIDPDNVDISVENDVLSIKGEAEKTSEVDDKNYYRREIRRGSFYRSVALPAHVHGDKAQATAENGVLKVVIPKANTTEPKKIAITKK